jgi:carboxymethylenebutenolidase
MGKMIKLTYDKQPFNCYSAQASGQPKGGVIVIHEVWGLNGHTKSVADRFVAEGYTVLAPDLLSETDIAKYADKLQLDLFNPKTRNQTQPKLRALMAPMQKPDFAPKTLGRVKACFDYLFEDSSLGQKVAICGFCFGGSYSFSLAMHEPRLKAALPFYGHPDLSDHNQLKQITCPILAFYGEADERLMESLPSLKEKMKAAGVDFTAKVYPDCGHAFFNDTNPYAHNEAAAKDAWRMSLAFLAENLS